MLVIFNLSCALILMAEVAGSTHLPFLFLAALVPCGVFLSLGAWLSGRVMGRRRG